MYSVSDALLTSSFAENKQLFKVFLCLQEEITLGQDILYKHKNHLSNSIITIQKRFELNILSIIVETDFFSTD